MEAVCTPTTFFPNRKKSAALLTPEQTAERLGVTIQTLAAWRCTDRYNLAYIRVGRLIRYRESAIEAFLESRTVSR